MKTRYTLDFFDEPNFTVLAINSHAKGYKLCWYLNQKLHFDFEKTTDHKIAEKLWFSRYWYNDQSDETEYELFSNRSKNGYLLPSQKEVNFLLKINKTLKTTEKEEFIQKIRQIPEILLIFEIDLNKIKQLERFIFNDKKN